jgi:uncharacterized membrane protein
LLGRLRRERLVTTFWRESEAGPPRRYYQLTPAGADALDDFTAEWIRFRDGVDKLLTKGKSDDDHEHWPAGRRLPAPAACGAATLPPPRRSELVAEIREHIDAALQDAGTRDEVAVRNVLERLGSPEEIAAEASDEIHLSLMPTTVRTGRPGVLQLVAAAALAFVSISAVIAALAPTNLGSLERGALLVVVCASGLLAWRLAMPSRWPHITTSLEVAALFTFVAGFLLVTLGLEPLVGWLPAAALVLMSRVWSGWDKLLALVVLPILAGLVVWSTTSSHLRTGEEWIFGLALSAPFAAGYLGWRLRSPRRWDELPPQRISIQRRRSAVIEAVSSTPPRHTMQRCKTSPA